MNILAAEYHSTSWPDVAFFAVVGLTIVGIVWARNRRKP